MNKIDARVNKIDARVIEGKRRFVQSMSEALSEVDRLGIEKLAYMVFVDEFEETGTETVIIYRDHNIRTCVDVTADSIPEMMADIARALM